MSILTRTRSIIGTARIGLRALAVVVLWLAQASLIAQTASTPTVQFPTVADMVAARIPATANRLTALVTGRNSTNDDGGGIFFYDSASAASTNLGTIFKPAASNGRWLRQYSGALNVKWFGAIGDNATDASSAIQAAVDLAATGTAYTSARGIGVFVPAGAYRINSTINLKAGLNFYGESRETTIFTSYVNGNVLRFDATGSPLLNQAISLSDFTVNQHTSVVPASGSGIDIGSSDASPVTFTVSDVLIRKTYRGVTTKYVQAANLNNLQVREVVDDGFHGDAPNNSLVFNNCYFRNNGGNGVYFIGTASSFIGCASESNTGSGYYMPFVAGSGPVNILINSSCELNVVDGIKLERPERVTIMAYVVQDSTGVNGVTIDGGSGITLINSGIVSGGTAPTGYAINVLNTSSGSYPVGITLFNTRIDSYTLGGVTSGREVSSLIENQLSMNFFAPTVTSGSDDIVIGRVVAGESHGVSILSGTDSAGLISFGKANTMGADSRIGQIKFDQPTGVMIFRATNDVAFLRSTGLSLIRNTLASEVSNDAVDLVVGNTNAQHGITILSKSDAVGALFFGDAVDGGGDTRIGQVRYDHSADTLYVRAGGTDTVNVTSTSANVTQDVILTAAGKGVRIKEGSNARMGTAALVNGTVTVNNTSVTANTRIFLTRAVEAGTTVGILGVGTVVANTSFVIESVDLAGALSVDDDSTVNWLLIEPSP